MQQTAMVKEFFSPSDDAAFKQWRTENPDGFYLNEEPNGAFRRNAGKAIMHRANCPFLTSAGPVSTTYSKVACATAGDLVIWLRDHRDIEPRLCHIYKP